MAAIPQECAISNVLKENSHIKLIDSATQYAHKVLVTTQLESASMYVRRKIKHLLIPKLRCVLQYVLLAIMPTIVQDRACLQLVVQILW